MKKVLKIILIAICIFILNVLLLLNSIKAANLASMLSTENITKNVKK